MRRWRLAAIALAAVLAAPAADRVGPSGGRAYAEGEENDMQYYKMILNEYCIGKCAQGPLCCAIVPVAPNTPG